MGKLFISENSKTETIGNKEVSVKYIAYASNINVYNGPTNSSDGGAEKTANINVVIKIVPEDKANSLTKDKLMQLSDPDAKVFNENMPVNLSKIPVLALELKNYKSSMDLHGVLEDYYFEQCLKKSVFGIINWIEKN